MTGPAAFLILILAAAPRSNPRRPRPRRIPHID